METIQTIWHALTTENELLANIITTPLIFIEATVIMLLFTTILKIKSSNKQNLSYVLTVSIIGLICKTFISMPYGTVINIILMIISTKLIFKISIIKSILSLILPMFIMVILEYIISNTYIKILNVPLEKLIYIPIHKFITTSLIYLAVFIVYKLFSKFHLNLILLDNISKKNKILLLFCVALTIISTISQAYLTTFYSENLPFLITILSIISLLSLFFISILSLTKTTNLELAKMDLEETKMYNKTLSILHDNIRCFKHDFNNIVQAIGGYISTNDIEGLKNYYYELQEDCQRNNNLSALNPDTINNPAIYSILASKYHKADSLGIKVNLEIFIDLNTLNMKIYEFTRILGILLDNAIEATSECDDKIINVYIRKDFSVKRQLLIIENTYKNKEIDIERLFEKGYSTKDNNTGLGLWEVRQILHKNKNLNLFTTKNNGFFKQQLEIY